MAPSLESGAVSLPAGLKLPNPLNYSLMLICEADFDIASVGKDEVSLDRAQTIMQGAPSCTFRYRFAPR